MEINTQLSAEPCTKDFHAPREWELMSTASLAQLARDIAVPGLPAPQIIFGALNALLNQHTGTIYGFDKKPIDLYAEFKNGDDIISWAFGGDWGRGMRRLLERGERPFKNQMKSTPKLLMRIYLLSCARDIARCRSLGGRCSCKAQD